jgi:PKD repeat protein
MRGLLLVLAATAVAVVALPAAAAAAPPGNDDFAGATSVTSLPFSETIELSEATVEPGEPACLAPAEPRTVWYSIAPDEDVTVRVRASSPFFPASLLAGRSAGPGLSDLVELRCRYAGETLVFDARAGETWYVRAAAYPFGGGGPLTLEIDGPPAPPNDDLAAATAIQSLPFADAVDALAAGIEPDEPAPSCSVGSPQSVWYSYTAPTAGWVTAVGPFGGTHSVVAAYTGTAVGSLSELDCRTFGSPFSLRVVAGATYYFRVAAVFGDAGMLAFELRSAPDPVAAFGYWPLDPSTFDELQLSPNASDPGGNAIASYLWDYGDGSPPSDSRSHRYAADGDYRVTLSVATSDGRTGSTTQTITVRTHDVAIKSFDVPASAAPGRTKQVSVGIGNTRLPEVADVVLYKSVPGGDFEQVGSQRVALPVRSKNAQTKVTFTVSFTPADLAAGKVTFKAGVMLVGARDGHPADNTVIALPTLVR